MYSKAAGISETIGKQHDSERPARGFALPWAFLVGRQSGRTQEDDANPAPSRASSHLPENPPVGSYHGATGSLGAAETLSRGNRRVDVGPYLKAA